MKAIYLVLPALLAQEPATLKVDPPVHKTLIAKLKGTTETVADGGFQSGYDSEAELLQREPDAEGRKVIIRYRRAHLWWKRGAALSQLKFERGKDPVIAGDDSNGYRDIAQDLLRDEAATLTRRGRISGPGAPKINHVLLISSLNCALPETPVKVGATWTSKLSASLDGGDYVGDVTFTVESIDAEKGVRITIKAAPKAEGEDVTWESEGALVYSLKDRLITDYRFSLVAKSAEGKALRSLKEEGSTSFKP